ncbi:MAG TPA: glycogen debranching N-terminal domain-containing protein, partial [Acidimicrobiales bacterium]|nr:glycogen debranching N-terminal domain-containing protein [Acidimicrobiales bacterium]
MAEGWTFVGESTGLAGLGEKVTLVEGSSFAISSTSGDIDPGSAQGFFFRDTRFLSRLQLKVNGQRPEALARATTEPFSATFVA